MTLCASRGLCLSRRQALPGLYELVTEGERTRLKRHSFELLKLEEKPLKIEFLWVDVYDDPKIGFGKITLTLGDNDIVASLRSDGSFYFRPVQGDDVALLHAQYTAIIYTALEEDRDYNPLGFAGLIPMGLSGDFDAHRP